MAYRDDLEVLRRRIEELEREIRERTRERDRLDSLNNLGPQAYGRYSRFMYQLGRGVRRALSLFARPPSDPARAVEAARKRVRLLEHRLAHIEEEVQRALKSAGELAQRDVEKAIAEKEKKEGGPKL
jgi:prefoldin subunit 5